ncbi:MAG: hypothetical protein KF736_11365 [Acidobacteria bacterium]|nr:hypothetical protein [Acidobacteriota bacterium]
MVNWYDIAGGVGVALIIGAYILLQVGRLDGKRPAYSAINAAGASLIIVSLYFEFNLSAFIVEFFWLLISLFGLGRYFMRGGNNDGAAVNT